MDESGKAIQGALVEVVCEQADSQTIDNIINGVLQKTNSRKITCNGRTPGKDNKEALLLTEIIKTATDTPDKPEVKEYSYTIKASAQGFNPNSIKNFQPQKSWEKVRVVLSKGINL